MAPTPEGDLLIGFRNPVPRGRALIMRLHNPADLVREGGHPAVLTLAAQLDLGGRGIRALEFLPEPRMYLVIAGSFEGTRDFRLYRWSGAISDAAVPVTADALAEINPEELVATSVNSAGCDVEVFSDDGNVLVRGSAKRSKTRRGVHSDPSHSGLNSVRLTERWEERRLNYEAILKKPDGFSG